MSSNYRTSWRSQRAYSARRIGWQAREFYGVTNPALAAELNGARFSSPAPVIPDTKPAPPRFWWMGWADEAQTVGIVKRANRTYYVRAGSPSARRIEKVLI